MRYDEPGHNLCNTWETESKALITKNLRKTAISTNFYNATMYNAESSVAQQMQQKHSEALVIEKGASSAHEKH